MSSLRYLNGRTLSPFRAETKQLYEGQVVERGQQDGGKAVVVGHEFLIHRARFGFAEVAHGSGRLRGANDVGAPRLVVHQLTGVGGVRSGRGGQLLQRLLRPAGGGWGAEGPRRGGR